MTAEHARGDAAHRRDGAGPGLADSVAELVRQAVRQQPIWDVHTHLYPPTFGTPLAGAGKQADPAGLMLWGVDELLTYHYLVAEVFRVVPASVLTYESFWRMTKREQADHIWKHLFLERSPVSEACRGVLTTLERLGLDVASRDLNGYRRWFAEQSPDTHIDRVMEVAGVSRITMTNAVFDDNERRRWLENPGIAADSRFLGVLRFDPLVSDWPNAAAKLSAWGYEVEEELTDKSIRGARKFLGEWINRVSAVYGAVSLPPRWRYAGADDQSSSSVVLREIVLPTLAERNLPFAMMIGAERGANPGLRDAGDVLGLADVSSLSRLCGDFRANRFLVTMLARENQHELAVAVRKFGNLMLFGCWWFLNTPSLIEEITRMRMELLGTSFIPQHSDARVLEQLIYKWEHSRTVVEKVLVDKYADLANTGWNPTAEEIRRDINALFHGNAEWFLQPTPTSRPH